MSKKKLTSASRLIKFDKFSRILNFLGISNFTKDVLRLKSQNLVFGLWFLLLPIWTSKHASARTENPSKFPRFHFRLQNFPPLDLNPSSFTRFISQFENSNFLVPSNLCNSERSTVIWQFFWQEPFKFIKVLHFEKNSGLNLYNYSRAGTIFVPSQGLIKVHRFLRTLKPQI